MWQKQFVKRMKLCILMGNRVSLSADVSDSIDWVAEASRGLSVCQEEQDRLVFFYSLQKGMDMSLMTWSPFTDL